MGARRGLPRRHALLLMAGAAIAAGAGPAMADGSAITGTVVYRERMLLPEGAQATVRLEDVSLADTPAKVLAETTVPATTSPTAFVLTYSGSALEPGHRYALRASISAGAELLFATTEHIAFDGTQTDGFELLVRRVAADVAATTIVGSWLAEDFGGAGVIDDLQSTLTIAADGGVTGHSGCNGFGGTATIEDDKLSFGPLAGTLMACAEAVMDQERKFYSALEATAAFRIDTETGKLFLLDGQGVELARFGTQ